MKILVRLPNWLGDVVMSTSFLSALKKVYPESEVDVIIKSELAGLTDYFEGVNEVYKFSKKEYPGIKGIYTFGKNIRKKKKYDLFFCLPDSLSSAMMGYFSGSRVRVGYKKELRTIFLTKAFVKGKQKHRAEEYLDLCIQYSGKAMSKAPSVVLKGRPGHSSFLPEGKKIIVNINSEAQSRKMPLELASKIIAIIQNKYPYTIILTGGNKDVDYVKALEERVSNKKGILNLAGKTSLQELFQSISQSDYVITTDSGIAHVGNAFGIKTLVLFGAGDDRNTAPFNKEKLSILRQPGLACAPCVSNTCKFGMPKCLTTMNVEMVEKALDDLVTL